MATTTTCSVKDIGRTSRPINWAHGWPFCFLIRRSPWLTADAPANVTRSADGIPLYSRWPFDKARVIRFYPLSFGIDVAVAAALMMGVFWTNQRFAARLNASPRFGLKSLFTLMTLAATFCAFGLPLLQDLRLRGVTHFLALMVLTAAALATLVAIGDSLWIVLGCLKHAARRLVLQRDITQR